MENVVPVNKNNLFVQDYEGCKKQCDRNFLIDNELEIKTVNDAIILPAKDPHFGGVFDENMNFIAGFFRHIPDPKKTASYWAEIYKPYEVEQPIRYDERTVVFGGVLIAHFGHMLLDNLTRMWWHVQNLDSNLPIVFLLRKGEYQSFFDDFLNLLDLPKDRIIILDEPTKFKQIIVPQEASHSHIGYHEQWLLPYSHIAKNALKLYDASTLPKKVYFAKSNFRHTNAGIINEEYFVNFYREHGFEIVNPEEYPVAYQVALASNATEIACPVGSIANFSLFSQDGIKLTLLSRTKQLLVYQNLTNQAKKIDAYYVDVSYNFLPSNLAHGTYLLNPNQQWKEYVKAYFGEDIELPALSSEHFREYVTTWTEIFSNEPSKLKTANFDMLDIVDIVKNLSTTLLDKLPAEDLSAIPTKKQIFNQLDKTKKELASAVAEIVSTQQKLKNLQDENKRINDENKSIKDKNKRIETENNKIKDENKKIIEQNKRIDAENKRINKAYQNEKQALQSIKNSKSYKLGRFITYIPRKIRNLFKRKKK